MKRKYPSTPHVPWSPGITSGDTKLNNLNHFHDKEVVVLEKLDGENTSLGRDYMHARSLDSAHNFTRDWVAALHAGIRYNIPPNVSLRGENMWAEHSIRYENLQGYFYLFGVFDGDTSLSYDEVLHYASELDLPTPKEFYRGKFDEDRIRSIIVNDDICEGYVIRVVDRFVLNDFGYKMAKYVRPDHVQTDEHWLKNAKQNGTIKGKTKPLFMGKSNE